MSVRLSLCPSAWNNSAFTGRIFIKFDILIFFENRSRKFKFYYNLKRKMCSLHEDQYTFMIKPRSVFLRMRNVSDRICREIKTHILCSVFFFPEIVQFTSECGKIYWIPQATENNIIRRKHVACWINFYCRHTPTICKSYCFPTATMIAGTRLNVTLYLHCLYC
jgi:hypothetical protein